MRNDKDHKNDTFLDSLERNNIKLSSTHRNNIAHFLCILSELSLYYAYIHKYYVYWLAI